MVTMNKKVAVPRLLARAAAVAVLGFGPLANGFEFKTGNVDGSFDSTLTVGGSMRTESRDSDYIGQFGNRNFDKWDVFTNSVKGTHDLEFAVDDKFGGFLRGAWFYDFAMDDEKLNSAASNRVESHGDILDAYLYSNFGEGDQFHLKVGRQVISWGENTFIPGSLNDINTVDVTKVRQAGVELKDALTATNAIYTSWAVNQTLSLSAFYLLGFDETKIDPSGAFFAANDFLADGSGFDAADGVINGLCLTPDGKSCGLGPVLRTDDNIPSYGGQWGVATRLFFPELLESGTEFGFYYMTLHDHNPSISYISNGVAGIQAADLYFADYKENIDIWGISFNTNWKSWAISGEWSHRDNATFHGNPSGIKGAGGLIGAIATAPAGKHKAWTEIERDQVQMTLWRSWTGELFGISGSDNYQVLGEAFYGWADLPSEPEFGPLSGEVDNDFWGYTVLFGTNYFSLIGPVNFSPSVAWSWNVEGTSTEISPFFTEDNQSVSLNLNFDYALQWQWGVSHTWQWGGDNVRADRDFLSVNLSYAF